MENVLKSTAQTLTNTGELKFILLETGYKLLLESGGDVVYDYGTLTNTVKN